MISISEHQEYLKKLYYVQNQQFNWDYLWGYLSRTTSYLFRAIDNNRAIGSEFVKPISWLFGVANKLEINLQEAFLRRFPNKCPYCLVKPCNCVRTKKRPALRGFTYREQIEEELESSYSVFVNSNKNVLSFEFLTEFIFDIYPQNELIWNIAGVGSCFHFKKIHEEIAEVHESICRYEKGDISKRSVEDELADVFAWLLSAWRIYSKAGCLTDEFTLYYKDSCPVCKQKTCQCGYRNERNQGLFDVSIAITVINSLQALRGTDFEKEANIHISSIKGALDSKTNYSIRTAVMQARGFLKLVIAKTKSETIRAVTQESLDKVKIGEFIV